MRLKSARMKCAVFAAAILLSLVPSRAHARLALRLGGAGLDVPDSSSGERPISCDTSQPDCDPRFGSASMTLAWSGHYPLVRMLNLSASPFLEAGSLFTNKETGARFWPFAFVGSDVWYWVFGTRLMVGPHMGVGWSTGGFKMLGGLGVSWCVSCSAGPDAGWFRRSVDRIELRRNGTFDPLRKQESQDGPGDPFTGSVDRFELSVVFRPDTK
jgi:hypothetical protein